MSSEMLTTEQLEEIQKWIVSLIRYEMMPEEEELMLSIVPSYRALVVERDKYKSFLFEDAHEHAERIKEIAGGPLPLSAQKSWDVWCEALAITYLGKEQPPDWCEWQDDEFAYACSDCGNSIAPGVRFWADRANPRHDRCVSCHAAGSGVNDG